MKNKLLFILLMVAILALSGCTGNDDVPDADSDASDEDMEYIEVYIDKYAFHPRSVTISRGDTVRWTNNDSVPFIIKSSIFQSPTLTKNMTFTYTFHERRTYNYYLATHPYTQSGTIVVE